MHRPAPQNFDRVTPEFLGNHEGRKLSKATTFTLGKATILGPCAVWCSSSHGAIGQ